MKREHIVIVTAILLIIVFILGGYFYKKQQSEKLGFMAEENASTFVREHSLTLGSPDAKVYLIELFDPACETCRAFYPFVRKLMAA
ncbi:MAG: disulfide bond formation protein DsbA, partial [Candidatus Electrothrix sp. ATG2]|nr:disulfide bond formation protein DsbA [Candidatus Electrothrix sp. ATG2]